jgi:pimeloyl-ACP methyl ester carboxylesterase
VLLLHGLGASRRYWDRVAPDLRPLPVVALDAPGHGETPADAADPAARSLEGIAADAALALDALGLSRVLVVGHSWGGAIALTLAARHPERVLGVIAIDGGFTPRRSPAAQTALVEQLLDADAPLLHRAQLAALLDLDPTVLLPRIPVACWLVACTPIAALPAAEPDVELSDPDPLASAQAKLAGLRSAASLLTRPRLLHWAGADHDVPLRWPALVTGLVRAAADDLAGGGR